MMRWSVATALAACAFAAPAFAEAPAYIPVQGLLSRADGTAVTGPTKIEFSLHDAPVKGKALWSETQSVNVDGGLFIAYLGFVKPLPLSFFLEHGNVWLGVKVESDPEMQRVFLGSVPFSAYAQHCGQVPEHLHQADEVSGVVKGGQSCTSGQVVVGFDAAGKPVCATPTSGTGTGYALAGQTCPPNTAVIGISADGLLVCGPVGGGGTYTGADFATSGQNCPSGKVATGISSSGKLVCDEPSGGLGGKGTSKRVPVFASSSTLEDSDITSSYGKVGVNNTSPSKTLDVKGDLAVSGDFYWGGNKFSSSSCLVVGGSSCSSACSAHGMSCYKAFRIDGESTSDSCGQSGFKFCCCTN